MIFVCVKNGAERGLTCASLGCLLAAAPSLWSLRARRVLLRFTWRKNND